MCRNGRYTEHGIKELDGFGAQRYVLPADAAVAAPPELGPLGVLIEPASVVAKAWDHIDRIGARAAWFPRCVLVTGAGPIGLLAALMGAQRGLEVHVLDVVATGSKPTLARQLGAAYHHGPLAEAAAGADVVIECTGVPQLVVDVMRHTGPAGIVCLAGVSSGSRAVRIDAAALNNEIVLENDVVFGSVNANAAHYRAGVDALLRADPDWLAGLLSRTVPLPRWRDALERRDGDVKVVIALDG
jgi:threonine dehydrogenase-like Zn-dependent dehydrogenase